MTGPASKPPAVSCARSSTTRSRTSSGVACGLDRGRYLLSSTVHQPVTGDDVVAVFLDVVERHGPPVSTLTDNGSVYTSRFTGGRNAFEYVLPLLGTRQKNGSPGHPQTQGKIERFHQTLQRWLTAQPPARSPAEL